MQASIDISMYPLKDDYCQPIIDFIERLKTYDEIKVVQNTMSTQIFGDYRLLMTLMTDEVEAVLSEHPKTLFVLKLIGTDRSQANIKSCEDE